MNNGTSTAIQNKMALWAMGACAIGAGSFSFALMASPEWKPEISGHVGEYFRYVPSVLVGADLSWTLVLSIIALGFMLCIEAERPEHVLHIAAGGWALIGDLAVLTDKGVIGRAFHFLTSVSFGAVGVGGLVALLFITSVSLLVPDILTISRRSAQRSWKRQVVDRMRPRFERVPAPAKRETFAGSVNSHKKSVAAHQAPTKALEAGLVPFTIYDEQKPPSPFTAKDDKHAAIMTKLSEYEVDVRYLSVSRSASLDTYLVAPGHQVRLSAVSSLAPEIAAAVGSDDAVSVTQCKQNFSIAVPRLEPDYVAFRDIVQTLSYDTTKLPLAIGRDENGNVVQEDLSTSHVLIAGTSGWGKSVAVRAVVESVLHVHTPKTARLALIDRKNADLSLYANIPHVWGQFSHTVASACELLESIDTEMEARATRFIDFAKHKKEGGDTPFIVLVIDEYAMLVMDKEDKKLHDRLMGYLNRIVSLGRSRGVRLVVAMQYPKADICPTAFRDQFDIRLSFKLKDARASGVMFNAKGAENIASRGEFLLESPMRKKTLTRGRGAYLLEEETKRVVKYLSKARPVVTRFVGTVNPVVDTPKVQVIEAPPESTEDGEIPSRLMDEYILLLADLKNSSIKCLMDGFHKRDSEAKKIRLELERRHLVGPLVLDANRYKQSTIDYEKVAIEVARIKGVSPQRSLAQ
jgi:hypothetical protein